MEGPQIMVCMPLKEWEAIQDLIKRIQESVKKKDDLSKRVD
jgi:hypothetical protein